MDILPPVCSPHPVNRGRASLPPQHSRSQLQRWQPSWTGGLFPSQCPGRWPSHLEPLLWLQLPGCPGSTSHSGGRKYMSCVSAGEEQDALIYWNHFGAHQGCCLFWISLDYHKGDTNERFINCKCTSMHPVNSEICTGMTIFLSYSFVEIHMPTSVITLLFHNTFNNEILKS